jgi:hypothetical protein
MRRILRDFIARRRDAAASRRNDALHKAAREMNGSGHQDGTIWRSGKGGSHFDRAETPSTDVIGRPTNGATLS